MFTVKNLTAAVDGKEILHGIDLEISAGTTHIIMGKNGSGKSTLLNAILRNPKFAVSGEILLDGARLDSLPTNEIAARGIFLGAQSTPVIEGLTYSSLLKHSANAIRRAKGENPLNAPEFFAKAKEYCALLEIPSEWLARSINEGFSGGEKKRLQMLSMLFAEPKIALLDEPDSGVDVDSMNIIIKAIAHLKKTGAAFVIVSHYAKLINAIRPDQVHIMEDGKIVKQGDANLAKQIENEGFSNV